MSLSRTLRILSVVMAVVVVNASLVRADLLGAFSEDFDTPIGNRWTQDAGKADISGSRVDDSVAQQWFGPSPGVGGGHSKYPWPLVGNAAVADGALMLGTRTGGGIAQKASNHVHTGIGTYRWQTQHERFYNGLPGNLSDTAPSGGSVSPLEKRLEIILLSDSETGDTNAASAGVKVSMGATADQGWMIRDMKSPGKPWIASYFCSGSEVKGTSCSADGYRSWHDGSIPTDENKLKLDHEVVISANGSGGYEMSYSYGQTGNTMHPQFSGLDVTAALSDVGGYGVPNGFINLATHDSGIGKWDNISYVPEPSSLVLLCLAAFGLFIRRKRS